jgi:hypothetical protein
MENALKLEEELEERITHANELLTTVRNRLIGPLPKAGQPEPKENPQPEGLLEHILYFQRQNLGKIEQLFELLHDIENVIIVKDPK